MCYCDLIIDATKLKLHIQKEAYIRPGECAAYYVLLLSSYSYSSFSHDAVNKITKIIICQMIAFLVIFLFKKPPPFECVFAIATTGFTD